MGDAAGLVNPLNGEGIDYGLESGRTIAGLLADGRRPLPRLARDAAPQYGSAFSIARRLAGLLTMPRLLPLAGPVGMRSRT